MRQRAVPRLAVGALLAGAVLALAAACGGTSETGSGAGSAVAEVVDGDTLVLADGRRVRLVQIDAPELGEGECYAAEARRALETLAPPGARVRLEADARLDRVDRFGRLLRYVVHDGVNVNLALVRRGAASVWLFDGDRGRHADELLRAARRARAERRGLWGACPRARLDPYRGVET